MNQELTGCEIKLFLRSPRYQVNEDAQIYNSELDQDEDSNLDKQLGVDNEELIQEEEAMWARTGKINMLLQELEEDFDQCSKILDQHIQ